MSQNVLKFDDLFILKKRKIFNISRLAGTTNILRVEIMLEGDKKCFKNFVFEL
jgi:hypothetical protein